MASSISSTSRPWTTGQLPRNQQEASTWIRAGWEPSRDDFRRLGPAGAAALGLEYVRVTPNWTRIALALLALGVIAWVSFRGKKSNT
jgi:hypothetical protein